MRKTITPGVIRWGIAKQGPVRQLIANGGTAGPPAGFVFLRGVDGQLLCGADGLLLLGVAT